MSYKTQSVYLSIIIVSYNTKDITRNCLLSIYQSQPKHPFEIIVIDNNSKDGSLESIDQDFPGVILIKNSENTGFTKANNQGIKISKGKYVLLLNSDTIVLPEALNRMISFMEKNLDAGAVNPRMWLDRGRTLQPHTLHLFTIDHCLFSYTPLGRLFPRNSAFKKMREEDIKFWLSETPLEANCLSAACMMVKREVIKRVGLLDENFFMFFEDTDWSLRMKKAGLRLFLLPEAEIVHLVHQSPSNRLSEIYWNSLLHYLKKYYRWPVIPFFKISLLLSRAFLKLFSYFNLDTIKKTENVELSASNTLHWPKVAHAKGYILEISVNPEFTAKGGSIVKNNSYEIPKELLPRCYYYWAVAPIYRNGGIGEFSEPKIFKTNLASARGKRQ